MLPTTPIGSLPTHDNFRLLLQWLDIDDEAAGQEYERIRQRLIRLFVCRGCHEPELLADRTIDRVTLKAPLIVKDYVGKPDLYFYGVAKKIHLEWLRTQERDRFILTTQIEEHEDTADIDEEHACLESCLQELAPIDRELILEYYRDEKRAKIIRRKKIASKMGITSTALHIRASRIRALLLNCLIKCRSRKDS